MISRASQPRNIQIDANRKLINKLTKIKILRTVAKERELRCEDAEFEFLIISASASKSFNIKLSWNKIWARDVFVRKKIIFPSWDDFLECSCRISTSFMHKIAPENLFECLPTNTHVSRCFGNIYDCSLEIVEDFVCLSEELKVIRNDYKKTWAVVTWFAASDNANFFFDCENSRMTKYPTLKNEGYLPALN